MKNNITNSALMLIAFVAVCLLMSFARPTAADEPKQYIVINGFCNTTDRMEKFQQAVNEKLGEGWHLQGGVTRAEHEYSQAMVK